MNPRILNPVTLSLMAESLRQAGPTARCSPDPNFLVVSESVRDTKAVVSRAQKRIMLIPNRFEKMRNPLMLQASTGPILQVRLFMDALTAASPTNVKVQANLNDQPKTIRQKIDSSTCSCIWKPGTGMKPET